MRLRLQNQTPWPGQGDCHPQNPGLRVPSKPLTVTGPELPESERAMVAAPWAQRPSPGSDLALLGLVTCQALGARGLWGHRPAHLQTRTLSAPTACRVITANSPREALWMLMPDTWAGQALRVGHLGSVLVRVQGKERVLSHSQLCCPHSPRVTFL